MSNIKPILLTEYLSLYDSAVNSHALSDEPIPVLKSDSKQKINYILSVPFQSVFGKVAYWGFYKKASILFYLMIKNHPLENGNKRLACLSLGLFYEINNRNFNLSNKDLYELAHFVAKSPSEKSNEIIETIKVTLKNK